jgi:hypothetical protein
MLVTQPESSRSKNDARRAKVFFCGVELESDRSACAACTQIVCRALTDSIDSIFA